MPKTEQIAKKFTVSKKYCEKNNKKYRKSNDSIFRLMDR
jgi:hypothetical protein